MKGKKQMMSMKLTNPLIMINGYGRFVLVSSFEQTSESEESLMLNGTPFLIIDDVRYTYE